MTQQFVTGTSRLGVSSTSLPAALAEAGLRGMELNLIRERSYHKPGCEGCLLWLWARLSFGGWGSARSGSAVTMGKH